MKRIFHVYILSNISKMLYIGVTNDIERRVYEHKQKLVPGFAAKYNLHRLVYLELLATSATPLLEKNKSRVGCERRKLH